MKVLPRLESELEGLTEALRSVATFVLAHPRQAVSLSTAEVAQSSGTSQAAAVRLAQRLGYRGFRELQIELAFDLGGDADLPHEPGQDREIDLDGGPRTVAAGVYAAYARSLADTLDLLDPSALEHAAAAVAASRQTHCFGMGTNRSTAADAHYNLAKLGVRGEALSDPYLQLIAAAGAGAGDVVLAFSHTGMNADLNEACDVARAHQAEVVAVTARRGSNLTRIASVTLYTAPHEIVFRGEPLSSRMSMIFLTDALFLCVALRRGHAASDVLAEVRAALASRRIGLGLK